jgi:hypothetical protein
VRSIFRIGSRREGVEESEADIETRGDQAGGMLEEQKSSRPGFVISNQGVIRGLRERLGTLVTGEVDKEMIEDLVLGNPKNICEDAIGGGISSRPRTNESAVGKILTSYEDLQHMYIASLLELKIQESH